MAEYLIQGETLTGIADQIRSRTGSTNSISPTDMGNQVQLVYAKGYTNGKIAITEGEKRDETNVTESVDVESRSVDVDIESGYYAKGILRTVDVRSVYNFGYTEGYNDGLAEGGGGGGDEPYDPTTVWLINDVPVAISSGISGTTINVLFNSAGEEFVKIRNNSIALSYYKSDGTAVYVWDSLSGWSNDAYKTITFPEEITDETLQTWLDTNATLISGGGGGGQDADISPEDSLTFMEQVQSPNVCFFSSGTGYCFFLSVFGEYGGRTIDEMIEIEYSSPSSNPLTISLINYTDMYAHYWVKATDVANDDQGSIIHIEALPQGDNSIDVGSHIQLGNPCEWKIEVQGARFAKYGTKA